MAYIKKTNWQYNDVPTENDVNRWEQGIADAHTPGFATDAIIGNRTIDDSVAAASGSDTPTRLWSKLGNMIKAITGKSNWYTAPAKTLEDVNIHIGAGGTVHAAATSSVAGFMSAADKTKLDGIASGANNYIHPSSHPASMITVADAGGLIVATDAEGAFQEIAAGYPISAMARQALINGNFDIWQRGTSFANPSSGAYLADRWQVAYSADGGTLPTTITHSRQVLTPGEITGSFYCDRVTVNGAGSGLGMNANYRKVQKVENGVRYLSGAGKKITVSFWAKSNIANKKIGVYLVQNFGSGGSPSAQEIINGTKFTLSNTWTKYTFTFNTNTLGGKLFGSNDDDYLAIGIHYMWGSAFAALVGDTVSESFVGAGNIDIAQVQVCSGDVALPFQPRSFAEELALCQRYYEKSYDISTVPGSNTGVGAFGYTQGFTRVSGGSYFGEFFTPFKKSKRTTPTITIYSISGAINALRNASTGLDVAFSSPTFNAGQSGFNIGSLSSVTNAVNAGDSVLHHWAADAEL